MIQFEFIILYPQFRIQFFLLSVDRIKFWSASPNLRKNEIYCRFYREVRLGYLRDLRPQYRASTLVCAKKITYFRFPRLQCVGNGDRVHVSILSVFCFVLFNLRDRDRSFYVYHPWSVCLSNVFLM